MKKIIPLLCICMSIVAMVCLGGKNKIGQNDVDYKSKIYTNEEIKSAIDVVLEVFKKDFIGCTLMEISYIGDERILDYNDFIEQYSADEVIVLVSSFRVDSSGREGSLNPNSVYNDWKWILVRNDDENWNHVDHGY